MRRFTVLAAASLAVGGCATVARTGFTALERSTAVPQGFDLVRYAPGDKASAAKIHAGLAAHPQAPRSGAMLALSGGGANGAYGVGVLAGWTRTGKRPAFDVVTGISTGALISPFAFLGPSWDDELKDAFTDGRAEAILKFRGLRSLSKLSLFSGKPLHKLAQVYVTEEMIRAVAAEHLRGRELLVATTDLDSQQMVLWDMGAIASRGGPAARKLFIKVLVASSSIPGVYPPVMIRTSVGSRSIEEMHVDGTMINAFFALPEEALLTMEGPLPATRAIYILVNGKVEEEFAVTRGGLLSVLGRSYDTMTKASWRASLSQVAVYGKRHNIQTHVARIPSATHAPAQNFSRQSMTALYDLGFAHSVRGHAWTDLQQTLRDAR